MPSIQEMIAQLLEKHEQQQLLITQLFAARQSEAVPPAPAQIQVGTEFANWEEARSAVLLEQLRGCRAIRKGHSSETRGWRLISSTKPLALFYDYTGAPDSYGFRCRRSR